MHLIIRLLAHRHDCWPRKVRERFCIRPNFVHKIRLMTAYRSNFHDYLFLLERHFYDRRMQLNTWSNQLIEAVPFRTASGNQNSRYWCGQQISIVWEESVVHNSAGCGIQIFSLKFQLAIFLLALVLWYGMTSNFQEHFQTHSIIN